METQEILRPEWTTFFNTFSKQQQGNRATVQVIGSDIGAQEEATSLPFVGISVEEKGSAAGAIIVMIGSETEDHVEHTIYSPAHVWMKSGGASERTVIEIESADGTKTILQMEPMTRLQS